MKIKTPTGTDFEFRIENKANRIVIISGASNEHSYHINALRDLYFWLKVDKKGDWVDLGSKGEEEEPNQGTIEEWSRSTNNPLGGFYGLKSGRKGRFASYIPSILEYLGFIELEHKSKNNRARAL